MNDSVQTASVETAIAAVRDGRMITAQSWKSHPEFYREVFACLDEGKA